MVAEPDQWGRGVECTSTDYRGMAVVDVPDYGSQRVDIDLVGGRERWSVGGRIAEGPRWWRGELAPVDDAAQFLPGMQVNVALEGGRAAPAVVESPRESPRVVIRGLGPPPFEVP